jgi:hypothetical protein
VRGRKQGSGTGWVDGAIGWEGHGILGWAAVEVEVDGLDVITLLDGDRGDAGQKAQG